MITPHSGRPGPVAPDGVHTDAGHDGEVTRHLSVVPSYVVDEHSGDGAAEVLAGDELPDPDDGQILCW